MSRILTFEKSSSHLRDSCSVANWFSARCVFHSETPTSFIYCGRQSRKRILWKGKCVMMCLLKNKDASKRSFSPNYFITLKGMGTDTPVSYTFLKLQIACPPSHFLKGGQKVKSFFEPRNVTRDNYWSPAWRSTWRTAIRGQSRLYQSVTQPSDALTSLDQL